MGVIFLSICVLMILAGAVLGLFSGIVPGIHVNTLTSVLLVAYPMIQASLAGIVESREAIMATCCCVVSASVVHSFVDFVPSVFIGAPDGEDAVSVLPGHRLLLEGRGMDAVKAAASGSLIGACCSVILAVPLQMIMSSGVGESLDRLSWTVAFIASSIIIMGCGATTSSKIWGTIAFCVSGILGMCVNVLDIPCMGVFGEGTLLFPMLTGLFGMPLLLSGSSTSTIPKQQNGVLEPVGMMPGIRGAVMGCIAGWFPGITSTIGASMSSCIFRERRPEDFIANVASIGTVTSILSLVALSVSGSGRSGTAIVIRDLSGDMIGGIASCMFLILLFSVAVSSLIGYYLTLMSGRAMSGFVSRTNMTIVNRSVLAIDCVLVLMLTGPCGLMILLLSTIIGMMPESCGTSRIVLCGCLLAPILLQTL